MGLSNLDVFDDTMTANRITFEAYRAGLAGIPGLVLRDEETTDLRNFHMVVVEVDEVRFGMSRDALVRVLTAENVLVRRYFHPGVHAMEPYRGRDPFAAARLPVTVEAASRVAVLPAGPEIAADTVSAICDLIRTAQALASQVLAALASASHADRL
jgi:dTDP-4-amino-4,6-dideoxygalactose transaminase